jgi:hypothetical protein
MVTAQEKQCAYFGVSKQIALSKIVITELDIEKIHL